MSVKIRDVHVGSCLRTDDGFTCMDEGELFKVEEHNGNKYVRCREGKHYLDGQICDDVYVGFDLVRL